MPREYRTLELSDYTITEDGKVINNRTGRHVKPQPNGKGYYRVSIGGKLRFVHRLVAEMYVPNPDNKPQVNHIDGDKTNNRADNLEWVTNGENRQHAINNKLHPRGEKHPGSKLTWDDVEFIRSNPDKTITELANMLGVSRSTVSSVRCFETWKTEKIC